MFSCDYPPPVCWKRISRKKVKKEKKKKKEEMCVEEEKRVYVRMSVASNVCYYKSSL